MAKLRSPNYPAVSLSAAIDLAHRLHAKEGRATVDAVLTVRAWGYAGLSGVARGKLSAVRKYGLIDDVGQGFKVSDRAMAILRPTDDQEKARAIREAALAPELFSELSSHVGASDDNLVSRLVRSGFTPSGATAAVASYRETMALVSDDGSSYDAGDELVPPVTLASTNTTVRDRVDRSPDVVVSQPLRYGLYDNVVVEVKVTGGVLDSRQIELLREYLALHEKTTKAREDAAKLAAAPVSSTDSSVPCSITGL